MNLIGEEGRDIRDQVFRRRRGDMRREMKVRRDRMLVVATTMGIIREDIRMVGIIRMGGMVRRGGEGMHRVDGEQERIRRERGIRGAGMGRGLTDRMGSIDIEIGMRDVRRDGSEGVEMFMCRVIVRDGGMSGIGTGTGIGMIGVVGGVIEMIAIIQVIQGEKGWITMIGAGEDIPGAEAGARCHRGIGRGYGRESRSIGMCIVAEDSLPAYQIGEMARRLVLKEVGQATMALHGHSEMELGRCADHLSVICAEVWRSTLYLYVRTIADHIHGAFWSIIVGSFEILPVFDNSNLSDYTLFNDPFAVIQYTPSLPIDVKTSQALISSLLFPVASTCAV